MTPIFFDTAARRLFGNPRVATQSRTHACVHRRYVRADSIHLQAGSQKKRRVGRSILGGEWDSPCIWPLESFPRRTRGLAEFGFGAWVAIFGYPIAHMRAGVRRFAARCIQGSAIAILRHVHG